MSVATSTAIALGSAAIGAGANVYAAHEASSGAKDAAKTQADASNQAAQAQLESNREALDFEKQLFNTRQQQFNPYQQYGGGALAMLGAGLGVTPAPVTPMTLPTAATTTFQGSDSVPYTTDPRGATVTNVPFNTIAQNLPKPATLDLEGWRRYIQTQQDLQQAAARTSSQGPSVGTTRMINGQNARWDGHGWEAI